MAVGEYDTKLRNSSVLLGKIDIWTCTEHYLLGLLFYGSSNPLNRNPMVASNKFPMLHVDPKFIVLKFKYKRK